MKRIITLLLALTLCLSLCACGNGEEPTETTEATTAPTETEPVETDPPVDPEIQEFAEKFFTACASKFVNPLSIEMKNAWYYVDSLGYYYFTFEFTVENSAGNRQKVFYGNDGLDRILNLTDEELKEVTRYVLFDVGEYFVEGGITAMQNGEPLDAEAIQTYFLKNY